MESARVADLAEVLPIEKWHFGHEATIDERAIDKYYIQINVLTMQTGGAAVPDGEEPAAPGALASPTRMRSVKLRRKSSMSSPIQRAQTMEVIVNSLGQTEIPLSLFPKDGTEYESRTALKNGQGFKARRVGSDVENEKMKWYESRGRDPARL